MAAMMVMVHPEGQKETGGGGGAGGTSMLVVTGGRGGGEMSTTGGRTAAGGVSPGSTKTGLALEVTTAWCCVATGAALWTVVVTAGFAFVWLAGNRLGLFDP